MPSMRTVLAVVSLALMAVACGDNLVPGTGTDAAESDGPTPTDARVDATVDANCPLRAQGQVGGPCTDDSQCDTAPNANDGACLDLTDGTIGWPAGGYCVHTFGCTMDAQCGAGNICVTINDPTIGMFSACLPECGADPCVCSNGQVCANRLATSPMNKMACIPGNEAAIDGDPCAGFGDCDVGSICLRDPAENPGGQCLQIGCTIGNDATCTSGGDGHCAMPTFASPGNACLDTCNVDADCRIAEGYECFDAGGSVGKYCRHPQTGDGCAVDTDCGDASLWDCRTGAGFPGGYCTFQAQCAGTNGAGCADGSAICYDPPGAATPYCVDRCSTPGSQGTCRAGYTCTAHGNSSGCI